MTDQDTATVTIERHSTREIVSDHIGGTWDIAISRGARRLGHNPSWVKAVDYDRLAEDVARLTKELADYRQIDREQDVLVSQLRVEIDRLKAIIDQLNLDILSDLITTFDDAERKGLSRASRRVAALVAAAHTPA